MIELCTCKYLAKIPKIFIAFHCSSSLIKAFYFGSTSRANKIILCSPDKIVLDKSCQVSLDMSKDFELKLIVFESKIRPLHAQYPFPFLPALAVCMCVGESGEGDNLPLFRSSP